MTLSAHLAPAALATALVGAALVAAPPAALAGFDSGAEATAAYSTAALSAPTGFAASVVGAAVTLTWTPAPAGVPAGTLILRAADPGGPFAPVATVAGGGSTYTDTPGAGRWSYEAESYTGSWTSPPAGPVTVSVAVPALRAEVGDAATRSGSATLALKLTGPVPAGDLLVVRTAIASSAPVASVSDGLGDTFSPAATVQGQRALGSETWTARPAAALPAGATLTVAWTGGAGSAQAVAVDDFAAAGAPTGSVTAAGHGTGPSVVATVSAGDLVVAATAVGASSSDTYTEATGWVPLAAAGTTGTGNSGLTLYGAYRVATTATLTHGPTLASPAWWTEADVVAPPG